MAPRPAGVELNSRVGSIRRANGSYLVETDERSYEADQVVVATGPFQTPFVPAIAEALGPEVVKLHSTAYRSPAQRRRSADPPRQRQRAPP